MPYRNMVRGLAKAFLAGEFEEELMLDRARLVAGPGQRWLRGVVRRYLRRFKDQRRPREREARRFIAADSGLLDSWLLGEWKYRPHPWTAEGHRMQPAPVARYWCVPAIESEGDLASWLGLTHSELEWLADPRNLCVRSWADEKLGHYHYRVLAGRGGDVRLIEIPKPMLKSVQQRILWGILEKIPAHEAAHGFIRGRSTQTFASAHCGQSVVVRMDLRRFFTSVLRVRVESLFLTAGYPERVANLLAGLCTTVTPHRAWRSAPSGADRRLIWQARSAHGFRHLPQGAPSSPALANLCAYRFDCRLAGIAQSFGASYSRYADDLAFSGGEGFARSAARLEPLAAAIAIDEGFTVNHRKTRIMPQSCRQRLVGLTVNQRPNIARHDFDTLKAMLTNCVRHGPESQNRAGLEGFRAHLDGRVGYVEQINPSKGLRLRRIFDSILWP